MSASATQGGHNKDGMDRSKWGGN